ncbi:MAG: diacylglycerol/lipid kinase family protein [Bacteroidia bacterium]
MTNRRILFIVNPNAGKKISGKLIEIIRKEIPSGIYNEIVIWKDAHYFEDIIQKLKTGNFTDAVAVGGDGTVNQVAKSILNTDIALGIVPAGSGNGLARSLGISMRPEIAVKQIAEGKTVRIDAGKVNEFSFFCTSGVGFDAHIGKLFASSLKRGLQSYIKITFRELFSYKPKRYTLVVDGHTLKRDAFLITVANAGQYGNDFYMAPQARLNDDLFHVVILKPFRLYQAPGFVIKAMRRKAHESAMIETLTCRHLSIIRDNADSIHYDGEPAMQTQTLHYTLNTAGLKVIIGSKPDLVG